MGLEGLVVLAYFQHPCGHLPPHLRPDSIVIFKVRKCKGDVLGLLLEQGPEHPVIGEDNWIRVCPEDLRLLRHDTPFFLHAGLFYFSCSRHLRAVFHTLWRLVPWLRIVGKAVPLVMRVTSWV